MVEDRASQNMYERNPVYGATPTTGRGSRASYGARAQDRWMYSTPARQDAFQANQQRELVDLQRLIQFRMFGAGGNSMLAYPDLSRLTTPSGGMSANSMLAQPDPRRFYGPSGNSMLAQPRPQLWQGAGANSMLAQPMTADRAQAVSEGRQMPDGSPVPVLMSDAETTFLSMDTDDEDSMDAATLRVLVDRQMGFPDGVAAISQDTRIEWVMRNVPGAAEAATAANLDLQEWDDFANVMISVGAAQMMLSGGNSTNRVKQIAAQLTPEQAVITFALLEEQANAAQQAFEQSQEQGDPLYVSAVKWWWNNPAGPGSAINAVFAGLDGILHTARSILMARDVAAGMEPVERLAFWDVYRDAWARTEEGYLDPNTVNRLRTEYGAKETDLMVRAYQLRNQPEALEQLWRDVDGDPDAEAILLRALNGISGNTGESQRLNDLYLQVAAADQGNLGNIVANGVSLDPTSPGFDAVRDVTNVTSWFLLDPFIWGGKALRAAKFAKLGFQRMAGTEDEVRAFLGGTRSRRWWDWYTPQVRAIAETADPARRGELVTTLTSQSKAFATEETLEIFLKYKIYTADDAIDFLSGMEKVESILKGQPIPMVGFFGGAAGDVRPLDSVVSASRRPQTGASVRAQAGVVARDISTVQADILRAQSGRRANQVYAPHMLASTVAAKEISKWMRLNLDPTRSLGRSTAALNDALGDDFLSLTPEQQSQRFAELMTDSAKVDEIAAALSDFTGERTVMGRVLDNLLQSSPRYEEQFRRRGWRRRGFAQLGNERTGLTEAMQRKVARWSRHISRVPYFPRGLATDTARDARKVYDLMLFAGVPRTVASEFRSMWITMTPGQRQVARDGLIRTYARASGIELVSPGKTEELLSPYLGTSTYAQRYAADAIPGYGGLRASIEREVDLRLEQMTRVEADAGVAPGGLVDDRQMALPLTGAATEAAPRMPNIPSFTDDADIPGTMLAGSRLTPETAGSPGERMAARDLADMEALNGGRPIADVDAGGLARLQDELAEARAAEMRQIYPDIPEFLDNAILGPGNTRKVNPEYARLYLARYYPDVNETDTVRLYRGLTSNDRSTVDPEAFFDDWVDEGAAHWSSNPAVALGFSKGVRENQTLAYIDVPVRDIIEAPYVSNNLAGFGGRSVANWQNTEAAVFVNYSQVPDTVRSTLNFVNTNSLAVLRVTPGSSIPPTMGFYLRHSLLEGQVPITATGAAVTRETLNKYGITGNALPKYVEGTAKENADFLLPRNDDGTRSVNPILFTNDPIVTSRSEMQRRAALINSLNKLQADENVALVSFGEAAPAQIIRGTSQSRKAVRNQVISEYKAQGKLQPVDPSNINGTPGAIFLGQTTPVVAMPNFAAFDNVVAAQSYLSAFLFNNRLGQRVTDLWTFGTLAGPRFQLRNGIEDIGLYALTGGKVGSFMKGRVDSQVIRQSTERLDNRVLIARQRVSKLEKDIKAAKRGEEQDWNLSEISRLENELAAARTNEKWLSDVYAGRSQRLGVVATGKFRIAERALKWVDDRDTYMANVFRNWVAPYTTKNERMAATAGGREAVSDLIVKALVRQRLWTYNDAEAKILKKRLARGASYEDLTPKQQQIIDDMDDLVRSDYASAYRDEASELARHLGDGVMPTVDDAADLTVINGNAYRYAYLNSRYESTKLKGKPKPAQAEAMYAALAFAVGDGTKGQASLRRLSDYWKAVNDGETVDHAKVDEIVSGILSDMQASRDWPAFVDRFRIASLSDAREQIRRTLVTLESMFTTRDGFFNQKLYSRIRGRDEQGRTIFALFEGEGENLVPLVTADSFLSGEFDTGLYALVRKSDPYLVPDVTQTGLDRAWAAMGRSLARMTREPIWYGNYMEARETFRPFQKQWEGIFGEEYARKLTTTLAAERAYMLTVAYVDNPAVRSQLAWNVRNVARFYRATEDFGRRLWRTARNNPMAFWKATLAWNAAQDTGFIMQDDFGEQYFIYPASRPALEVINNLSNKLGFGVKTEALPMGISGNLQWITPSADPEAWVPTMSGFWSAILFRPLMRSLPAFDGFTSELEKVVFGDISASQRLNVSTPGLPGEIAAALPSALPPIVNKLAFGIGPGLFGLGGPETFKGRMATRAALALEASGNGLAADATDDEVAEYLALLDQTAVNLSLFSLFSGLFLVSSPQMFVDDVSRFGREIGVDNLRPAFLAMLRQETAKPDGDPMNAFIRFTRENPGVAIATVSTTESGDYGYIATTRESVAYLQENQDLWDENPLGTAFFAPVDGQESLKAFLTLRRLGVRVSKDTEKYVRDLSTQAGYIEYMRNRRAFDATLDAAVTDEQRQQARDAFTATRRILYRDYPGLEGRVEGRAQQATDVARNEADDVYRAARVLAERGNEFAQRSLFIFDQYLAARARFDAIDNRDPNSGDQRSQVKDAWDLLLEQQLAANPDDDKLVDLLWMLTTAIDNSWRLPDG